MRTKIAHLTDLHIDDFVSQDYNVNVKTNVINVINDMVGKNIKNIIVTGDFGSKDSFEWLNNEFLSRKFNVFYALGNHDELSTLEYTNEYSNRLHKTKLIYEVLIDGINILIIDTSFGEVDCEQLEIIGTILSKNKRNIVFAHHPIIDCGNTIMDRLFPLKKRKEFSEYLQSKSQCTYYFCGHYHNQYKNKMNNIEQFVTPSLALQLLSSGEKVVRDGNKYGYRIINIFEDEINTEVVLFEYK